MQTLIKKISENQALLPPACLVRRLPRYRHRGWHDRRLNYSADTGLVRRILRARIRLPRFAVLATTQCNRRAFPQLALRPGFSSPVRPALVERGAGCRHRHRRHDVHTDGASASRFQPRHHLPDTAQLELPVHPHPDRRFIAGTGGTGLQQPDKKRELSEILVDNKKADSHESAFCLPSIPHSN